MNKLIYLIIPLFLMACNEEPVAQKSTAKDSETTEQHKTSLSAERQTKTIGKSTDGIGGKSLTPKTDEEKQEALTKMRTRQQGILGSKLIRASGTNPVWILAISDKQGITIVTEKGSQRMTLPYVNPTVKGNTTIYETGNDKAKVKATFVKDVSNPCLNEAGNKYSDQVTLQVNDNIFKGCGGDKVK